MNLLRLFARELKSQRKRMTLTIIALAWGTFSIVILLAFGEGLNRQMTKAFHGLGEGICIVSGGQTSKPFRGLGKGRRVSLQPEDVGFLEERVEGIDLISPETDRWGNTLAYGRKTITQRVIGVSPAFEELRTYYPDEHQSRFLNETDMEEKRRVIFLGIRLKEKLFGAEEAVGKTMLVNAIPFLVVGIMQDKMQNSMYNGPDVEKASIPHSTYQAIFGDKYLARLIYRPKDLTQSEAVKSDVVRVLAQKYKFDPEDKQAINFWDTVEEEKSYQKVFLGIKIFMGIIGGLTLIVAGVGVANIMYVSARRRTREIGIKMALGAKKRYILAQFISEALMIALVGGAAGIGLSFAAVTGLNSLSLKGDIADILAHPVISPEIMVLTAVILGLIGFLAGFFPARRAASLSPVEALRY
ncbi:MAG: ABC transporter permease, partial [Acidobacteriota bacterium]